MSLGDAFCENLGAGAGVFHTEQVGDG